MANISRHQDLEDYFVETDASNLGRIDARAVCSDYESGKAILLKGLRLDYDRAFLASVTFPAAPKPLKKFASHRFLEEVGAGPAASLVRSFLHRVRARFGARGRGRAGAGDGAAANGRPGEMPSMSRQVLEQVFDGDRGRLRYFTEQVRHLNAQILRVCRTLFPDYRAIHESITWRFSETVNENLHVDVYAEDLPEHHLRLFVNVDDSPRLWHASWTLEQLLRDHLHRLDPEFVRTATPGRICHDLNFLVFGRVGEAGRDGQPRHIASFEPGEVWLVDSRKVSHQIVYGRRAISTDFAIERASMMDPEQHYYALVERHRRARASAGAGAGR